MFCVSNSLIKCRHHLIKFCIKVEPIIVDISKTVFVDSGESASLFCMAFGNPMTPEVIEWRREGKSNLLKDSRINVKIERGRSTLWISNVSPEKDVGEYECRGLYLILSF